MRLRFYANIARNVARAVNDDLIKPSARMTGVVVSSTAIGLGINEVVEGTTDYAKKTYNDYVSGPPKPN